MCKGLSGVATKDNICWLPADNSHTTIKTTHGLNDRSTDLAPFELYPRGTSVFSTDRRDWGLVWENKPDWFVLGHDTDRVFKWLEQVVFPDWRTNGIATMRLDALGYCTLPQDMLDIVRLLNCSGNLLTSLSAPKAVTLNCHNNQLTSLSAPKAVTLHCSYNRLTSLSAPKAEMLYCSGNVVPEDKLRKTTKK